MCSFLCVYSQSNKQPEVLWPYKHIIEVICSIKFSLSYMLFSYGIGLVLSFKFIFPV